MTGPGARLLLALTELVSRRHLLVSAALTVGVSCTEAAGLVLLLPLLQWVGLDSPSASHPAGAAVVRALQAIGVPPSLGAVLGLYVAAAALQSVLRRWQPVVTSRIVQDVALGLRRRLYAAIASMRWEVFVRQRSADLTHALTVEVDRAGIAAHHAVEAVFAAAVAVVYVAVAITMSPEMTGVVAVAGVVLALSMRSKLTAAKAAGERVAEAMAGLHAEIAEQIGSMKTTRSYGAEGRSGAVLDRLSATLHRVTLSSSAEAGRTQQHLTIGSTLALAAVVYGAVSYLAIPTAELLVLLFVFARLMPRVTGLYERIQFLAALLPAFDRVNRLTQACKSAAEADEGQSQAEMARDIRFDRVTFDYESRESAPALRHVGLTMRAGAMTAIVGPSGAGKSTLADLLLGLVTPTEGHILLDGRPLRADQRAAWRARVGYVPQDTFLFHDTVRANLIWARPDADDGAIWRALKLSAADQFVAGLPDGLETVVGDRGVLLSGGERQRLALARALLREPDVLVLDEATSALDARNESRILAALEPLRGQMTIVLLTHRLSAIRDADAVYVLENGEVVESGTVVQLMARPAGRFRAMWRAQDLDVEIGPSPTALLPV